jgi:hypothetical protein
MACPGPPEKGLMPNNLHRKKTIHLAVLAVYALLAVALTWPLVLHLGTHVPGSDTWAFDEYTFVWNSWWFRYSLLELGQDPLYSGHTFYPLGISLALYTYNLFNAVIALPLALLPLPAISNLTFLLTTVLTAYGAFLLVRYLAGNGSQPPYGAGTTGQATGRQAMPAVTLAAFLAGLIYAFGSYRMVYAAIGHYDMWSTAWIPFYTLFFLRTVGEGGRPRHAVLAGLSFALAMLNEMIFGVFLAMLSAILLAFALRRQPEHGPEASREVRAPGPGRARRAPLVLRLGLMALVAALLYAPILSPILREMAAGYELAGWGDAEKLSVDLVGLVTPTALHPLGGDWTRALRQALDGTARFRDVNTVFLGWAGLGLALVGALAYRRRLAAWITGLGVFAIFSLGPLLQINGRSAFDLDGLTVNVPLPFILLHYMPLVKANRVPNRFAVVLMLALAVLAAFGALWLLGKAARRGRAGKWLAAGGGTLLALLVLFDHWSVPLPLTDARLPAAYEALAAEPGDFAILQLPLGWRNSFGVQGAENTRTQYYQAYHHKRLLSGNISRNPPFKFDYFRQVPILESLITLQTYGEVDAERRARDRETAAEFVRFYDIRYVVVAPGVPGRPPYVDTRGEALAYVEEVLPVARIYDAGGWVVLSVEQTPLPARFVADLGSAELPAAMALGEGWAGDEEIQGAGARWAVSQGARIFLPAEAGKDHRLELIALPFQYPGAPQQAIIPEVNGRRLEARTMEPGWGTYAWDVPAGLLGTALNEVRLSFRSLAAPAEVLPGSTAIGSTGLHTPVAIEVNSGGPAGFAYITIGTGAGAEDGSLHSPGYNLAIVDARSGRIRDRQAFDTTPGGSEAQAAALVAFVRAIPQGQIVVAAMHGDGAALLTAEAVDALHSIGGQADPRGSSGWSHALIGVKGAAPGTALEAAGPENGWLRLEPDVRTLAVAVDRLLWERND